MCKHFLSKPQRTLCDGVIYVYICTDRLGVSTSMCLHMWRPGVTPQSVATVSLKQVSQWHGTLQVSYDGWSSSRRDAPVSSFPACHHAILIQKVLYQLSHPSSFTEDFNSKSFKHFNIKACKIRLGMFVPTFNSITCEAEAGVSLWVVSQAGIPNQSGLHCEILFQKKSIKHFT